MGMLIESRFLTLMEQISTPGITVGIGLVPLRSQILKAIKKGPGNSGAF
jgi:hypothetical protein